MFKQFTVGKKIACGFSLVLLLLVIVGGIARFALNEASEGFTSYRNLAKDSNLAGRVQANMIEARFGVKDYLLDNTEEDLKKFEERWKKLTEFVSEAKKEITDPENAKKINEVVVSTNDYKQGFDKVVRLQVEGEKLFAELNANGPLMEKALTEMLLSAKETGDFEVAALAGLAMRDMLLGRLYGTKYHDVFDIKYGERARQELGNMQEVLGAIDKKLQDSGSRKRLTTVSETKAQYLKALDGMVQAFSERKKIIEGTLDRIGPKIGNDIEEVKLSLISQQDKLGPRLQASNARSVVQILVIALVALGLGIMSAFFITRGITGPVRRIVEGLTESADQTATASGQVSSSSQQLADGASEQAASIEETSASIEEMSSMTKQNAQNAGQANHIMQETASVVAMASASMTHLTSSMQEISKASEETSKIIKTIDEIAFQTNLLALNAAVEAARAGEAGAGFAVVADEVRNLAMRAAEAAKNTAALIEGTVKRVKEGSELVQKTNAEFQQVTASASKMGELIGEISAASQEQAQGIEEVNKAVSEMDKVVQQNAATAEESAAASEELNAQAEQMKEFVASLGSLVGGNGTGKAGNKRIKSYSKGKNRVHVSVSTRSSGKASAPSGKRSRNGKETAPPLPKGGAREVRPEQLIPFEEGEFNEF